MNKTLIALKIIFKYSLLLTIVSIIGIEVLVLFIPQIMPMGTYVWFFSYLFLFILVLKSLVIIFKNISHRRFLFSVFVLGVLLFVALYNINNPKLLSAEMTQELACTLENLNKPDRGFHATCLFGYPARQFFLPVIPTILFGPSQLTMHVGGIAYFIAGLLIFLAGIMEFYKKSYDRQKDLFTAIILTFPLHIYFFIYIMFSYEQSFFPVSLAFILGGLYLWYIRSRSLTILFYIGLVLLYSIHAYTPSLALFYFAILVYLYNLIKLHLSKGHFIIGSIILILLILSNILSFKYRYDISLLSGEKDYLSLIEDIMAGFEHVLFDTLPLPVFTSFFTGIFLIFMALSLGFGLGASQFFVGVWILAVFAMAIIAKGYTYYSVDFRLHRANIIFPVMFTVLLIYFEKYKHHIKPWLLIIVFTLFLSTGIWHTYSYLQSLEPDPRLRMIQEIQKESLPNLEVIYSDGENSKYVSMPDTFRYFYAGVQYYYTNNLCTDITNNLPLANNILVITQDEDFKQCSPANYQVRYLGSYRHLQEPLLYKYLLDK